MLNDLKTPNVYMYKMSPKETPDVSNTPSDNTEQLSQGRVKWFNNKAGYGFVTISSGEHIGEDVFVHHSAINVSQEQYRYLIQGEYVEFKLCSVNDSEHKWQAGSVHGINNGKLMCETRQEARETRSTRRPPTDEDRRPNRNATRDADVPSHYRVRTRGPGPREGEEWMLVRRRVNNTRQNTASSPTKEVLRTRQPKATYKDGDN